MGNWVNWLLVIVGILCVIAEVALGAITGFDLALVGGSLAVGGGIGLAFGSPQIGLLTGGGLALVYFGVFRGWLRSKLQSRSQASNVDAVVGKTGVVTKRIAPRECGVVKVGSEEWRAELASDTDPAREIGVVVTVASVEGVTLKVR
jgi:membrane protein implicated in regulation of membrane protease activity